MSSLICDLANDHLLKSHFLLAVGFNPAYDVMEKLDLVPLYPIHITGGIPTIVGIGRNTPILQLHSDIRM